MLTAKEIIDLLYINKKDYTTLQYENIQAERRTLLIGQDIEIQGQVKDVTKWVIDLTIIRSKAENENLTSFDCQAKIPDEFKQNEIKISEINKNATILLKGKITGADMKHIVRIEIILHSIHPPIFPTPEKPKPTPPAPPPQGCLILMPFWPVIWLVKSAQALLGHIFL